MGNGKKKNARAKDASKKIRTKRIKGRNVFVGLAVLAIAAAILWGLWESNRMDANERRMAETYADIYGVRVKDVMALKRNGSSWDAVNAELANRTYAITEDEKYRLAEEGYAVSDLNEAERLAFQTGTDPLALIRAKGTADEGLGMRPLFDAIISHIPV